MHNQTLPKQHVRREERKDKKNKLTDDLQFNFLKFHPTWNKTTRQPGSRNHTVITPLFAVICGQNTEPLACLQCNVPFPPLRLVWDGYKQSIGPAERDDRAAPQIVNHMDLRLNQWGQSCCVRDMYKSVNAEYEENDGLDLWNGHHWWIIRVDEWCVC